MFKHLLAAAIAAALIAAPAAPAVYAQAASEKSETKKPRKAKAAKKELTPQQAKMKDCAAKWGDHKKEKKVKGRAEYRKFMSGCLKA